MSRYKISNKSILNFFKILIPALCALGFVSTIYLRMVEASKHLHDELLENIMHQPMKFFDTTPVGRILNRFSRDVDIVDSTMPRLVRMFSQQLFTVLSVLVVISYTTPVFVAAVFPVVIIYYLLQVGCFYTIEFFYWIFF